MEGCVALLAGDGSELDGSLLIALGGPPARRVLSGESRAGADRLRPGLIPGWEGSGARKAVSYLAMAVWAYAELVDGVNWFRHLLGLAYVVSTAVHLAAALGH